MGDAAPDSSDATDGSGAGAFPTRFTGPGTSPGFLLWQATNAWQRRIRAVLEPLEVTHVQFVLLASLGWMGRQEDAPTQADLARLARTDVMMTSQVLRALEARALVTRTPAPHDARARLLALTAAGRALVARALPLVESADVAFFAEAGVDAADAVAVLGPLAGMAGGGGPAAEAAATTARSLPSEAGVVG